MQHSSKILLLDSDTRYLLTSHLATKGYSVETVSDLLGAYLCSFADSFIAVVIALDLDQEELRNFCRRIKGDTQEIILLSNEQCPHVPTCVDAVVPSWPPSALVETLDELRYTSGLVERRPSTSAPMFSASTAITHSAKRRAVGF